LRDPDTTTLSGSECSGQDINILSNAPTLAILPVQNLSPAPNQHARD
jgi:hypothetical protein